MKILVLSHLYPSTFNKASGVYVHEQVKELVRQGAEVVVVSPVRKAPFPINLMSRKWKAYSESPLMNKVEGIKVYHPRYISPPRGYFFEFTGEFMYKGVRSLIKEIRKEFNFDLIHAHIALPEGYAAMKISQEMNVPYVLTIHGQDFLKTIFKNDRCKKRIEQALTHASKVILVSDRLNKVRKKHLSHIKNKFEIIFNGVNQHFLENENHQVSYFKNECSPKLLSVSNLIEQKGIEFNIKAVGELVKKYENLQYLIAGEGTDQPRLKQLVNLLRIEKHVQFIGSIDNKDIKKIMDECDVFSMPSWNEAFGVVYIEAMACGKPVIGCEGEGIEDIVEHEISGFLVPPKNENSIVKVLDKLFEDHTYSEKIGQNAKKRVKEMFTWEANVKQIKKVYEDVFK